MNAKIYAVPVGVINGQFVTTIEVYVPDLLLAVNSANSGTFESKEEAEEKYEELEPLKEIVIKKDEETLFSALVDAINNKNEVEYSIFSKMEQTIKDAVNEFKNTPKIHIPTAGEIGQLRAMDMEMEEDDDDNGGRIIFDG